MLIDGTHPEEIRVVITSGNRLEEYDVETSTKTQLKGNIYLAKVTRVEPSLQAAFVDYGGNRHGFLAFNEIHPDYYQIPIADKKLLLEDNFDDEESDNYEYKEFSLSSFEYDNQEYSIKNISDSNNFSNFEKKSNVIKNEDQELNKNFANL